jgi:hypothetical protein
VRRTWAPQGRTPVIRHHPRRGKLSAISALTVSPRRRHIGLYFAIHAKNVRQPEAARFVRQLLRHIRGHVMLIWDNGRPHKGDLIRDLCRKHTRLHVEYLPAYAPELNPDEGVWNCLDTAMANGCPDNLAELYRSVRGNLVKVRNDRSKLRWCIHQSTLPLFLP